MVAKLIFATLLKKKNTQKSSPTGFPAVGQFEVLKKEDKKNTSVLSVKTDKGMEARTHPWVMPQPQRGLIGVPYGPSAML